MTRDKEWWSRLTKSERSELYWLERASGGSNDGYLPEGYGECGVCGTPCLHDLCSNCLGRLIILIDKAEGRASKDGGGE